VIANVFAKLKHVENQLQSGILAFRR